MDKTDKVPWETFIIQRFGSIFGMKRMGDEKVKKNQENKENK